MILVSFLTKEEMAKAGEREREELDKIMEENGYRDGYGTRVMLDDVDSENDTRP